MSHCWTVDEFHPSTIPQTIYSRGIIASHHRILCGNKIHKVQIRGK